MEARFVILHPDDPGEILLSTTLIRCLKTQVEEAQVYSVMKDSHHWLLEANPWLDGIFVYQDKPDELLELLKDFLPDYLIDLDGSRKVRRFKNRLKVLDFSINRKNQREQWSAQAFKTCSLFDVQDDGKGRQFVAAPFDPELLPSEFLKGYVVLSLESCHDQRPIPDDRIIELAVMTEKPIVITGRAGDRDLSNRISQSTGCAVFPTCGDLTSSQIASVIDRANGAIVFDSLWNEVATVLGTERITITENTGPAQLKEIALWARSLFNASHDRITI